MSKNATAKIISIIFTVSVLCHAAPHGQKGSSFRQQSDDGNIEATVRERSENNYYLPPVKRNNASANNFGFGFIPLAGDSVQSAQRICVELEAFQCHTNDDITEMQCIESYLTCDQVQHCPDGSDEFCDNGLEACACRANEYCNNFDHKCHLVHDSGAPAARVAERPLLTLDDGSSSENDDDLDLIQTSSTISHTLSFSTLTLTVVSLSLICFIC